MSLKPLNHHYSMENTASIYDEEALTALELAGRTTAKVNETVEAFNNLEQETEDHLIQQDARITKMNDVTMPAKVEAEFKENLDDGTFEEMIDQYAGLLTARVNNLVANTVEGGTTMDAEVIDARTGQDGTVHTSLGNAIRNQIKSALKYCKQLTDLSVYSNADSLPSNTMYLLNFYGDNADADFKNLPSSAKNGLIVTMGGNGGYIQFFIDTSSGFWVRPYWGGKYLKWYKLTNSETLDFETNDHFKWLGQFNTDEVLQDLNNVDGNRMAVVTLYQDDTDEIAHMPEGVRHLSLLSFGSNSEFTANVQFAISNTHRLFYRNRWGSASSYYWSDWTEVQPKTATESDPTSVPTDGGGLLNCFHNVGCIGDSLCAGEVVHKDSTGAVKYWDTYVHSWGKYLEKMTGNTYHIWASGGQTAKSWLASSWASECFDGEHKCEAYIIGLGVNDNNDSVTVGSTSDINMSNYNLNADSYYGNYGKIIQKIKEVQPKAKIFVITNPLEDGNTYNAAVRNMASLFDNVFVIDLHAHCADKFKSGFLWECIRKGHYSALGYSEIARYMASYIDWIMRTNVTKFQDIEFIGTDYSY